MAKNTALKPAAPAADSTADSSKTPKREIKLEQEVKLDQANNKFQVIIDCLVTFDDVAVVDQEVIVREKTTVKSSGRTNQNGVMTYSYDGILSDQAQDIKLRFCLGGFSYERLAEVQVPPITPEGRRAAVDKDPETLVLSRYNDGKGNFRVQARVLRHLGVGLKTRVNIWYRGISKDVETNGEGIAVYKVPGTLAPGEAFPLQASVSGIAEPARVKIIRPNDPPDHSRETFFQHYFCTNHGLSLVILMMSFSLWAFCFIVGPGEPLINSSTFRNQDAGLSQEEIRYNAIVSTANGNSSVQQVSSAAIISSPENNHRWQRDWWKAAVILTFIAVFYFIVVRSEDFVEGCREGLEKMFDHSYAKAGDPAFEKLVKWAGTYSVSHRRHNPGEIIVSQSGEPTAGTSVGARPTLSELFSLDLLSDVLVNVVPSVVKKIF